jgi:hypothetical protein
MVFSIADASLKTQTKNRQTTKVPAPVKISNWEKRKSMYPAKSLRSAQFSPVAAPYGANWFTFDRGH